MQHIRESTIESASATQLHDLAVEWHEWRGRWQQKTSYETRLRNSGKIHGKDFENNKSY